MAREIVFLVFPDFQILDLTGPLEVFSQAERADPGSYRLRTVALDPGQVVASCGLPVVAEAVEPFAGADTLVVVGGRGTQRARADPATARWIQAAYSRSRRTASVCSGAFLLAEAGLLDGRRATTHWQQTDRLAAAYPRVTVESDPIFVRDGNVSTSAGVTAGIDLALALVEEDLDPAAARAVARQLVVFVQRPGGQRQFSAQLAAQRPARGPLRDVQSFISAAVGAGGSPAELSVPALAARAGLSERHFTRLFRAATGESPAVYVETVRVESARRLLETTGQGLDAIARSCGFGTVATMHRAFRRMVQVTPGEYRERFAARSG
ncbi:MAG TPA: GlxA family transcriptional regulator [Actinocrinis sp.]|nr:GlxA family transcriptional regulator [Actinocrinis sp.]